MMDETVGKAQVHIDCTLLVEVFAGEYDQKVFLQWQLDTNIKPLQRGHEYLSDGMIRYWYVFDQEHEPEVRAFIGDYFGDFADIHPVTSDVVDQFIGIDESAIISLWEKASDCERKFMVELKRWERPCFDYTDFGRYEVVHGSIHEVLIKQTKTKSINETTNLIIPLTSTVVVRAHGTSEISGVGPFETFYIFMATSGWKVLES